MNHTNFTFLFPITEAKANGQHLGDLNVSANATVGRLNKIIEVQITRITFFQRGISLASDVHVLIKEIAPELYYLIASAANNHAETIFSTDKKLNYDKKRN